MKKDEEDPQNWDRSRALDFLKAHSRGRIDPETILPNGNGQDLVLLPEHEFIKRALTSPKATENLVCFIELNVINKCHRRSMCM